VDESSATDLINTLYDTQRRGMLRYLIHGGASLSQGEDIIQDAFMELYVSLRSGKSIKNPRSWLFTVARHAFLKLCNASHRLDQLDESAVVDAYSSLSIVAPEPQLDEVERMFSILTPRERQVMTLRLSGLRYREIAAQLGINFKTAHTLLTRGLKRLHAENHQNSEKGRVANHELLQPETLQ
jgi:RNA polymerase sigma-70 factor (ECF subfamily)